MVKINKYWKESVHTQLSYWFVVFGVGIQLYLGIRYFNLLFGQLCIVEAVFGLSGILLLDFIHGKDSIYPKRFKKIHPNTFFRFAITFAVIVSIQFLFQIIPLITSTEMALGVVFAAVCEEYFFRGVILEPFFKIGVKADKFTVWNKKKMSYIELLGIMLSAAIFAAFHVNYYGQVRLMGMVLIGGLWLGFVYWWNKDITAIIIAHFLINIIFILQFYQVIF